MPETRPDDAKRFLDAVQGSAPIDLRTCIVLAHPDDETIALGAQLPRLRNAWLVLVTDGAPRNGADAHRAGFGSPPEYAAARARELSEVLRLTGFDEARLLRLAFADQEAALRLPELVAPLSGLFRELQPSVVVTHSYEGGHPDHDATAFAVHLACRDLPESARPALIEVPLYHLGPTGRVCQEFVPLDAHPQVCVDLTPEQRELKRKLFGAHASQRETLGLFHLETERFRAAPFYDFAELPNGGAVLYDAFGWDFTSARWQELARAGLHRLAGERAA